VRFTNNRAASGGAISVTPSGVLQLTNTTFTNNTARDFGGAIYVEAQGNATVTGSTFTSNSAGEGGAIQSVGTLIVSGSAFTGNASGFNGGALRLFGTATVDRSTFEGNTVANEGGALISFGGLTVTNSTFADNGRRAVLLWQGAADLRHVTIAYNRDGGLANVGADATLRNSVVAGNAGFDQSGALNAGSAGNVLNVPASAARLGALADNGGPTRTVALLPGSPAIDAGVTVQGVTTDQRGVARPQGLGVDAGAYERVAAAAPLQSAAYDDEARQAVTFAFPADASPSFGRSSFTLLNETTGQPVPASAGTLSWDATGTTATLVLTNQLADGNYLLTSGSNPSVQLRFRVLAGDVNRDGAVDAADLAILTASYGQTGRTLSGGNADYSADGRVDASDLAAVARNYAPGPAALLEPARPASGTGSAGVVRVALPGLPEGLDAGDLLVSRNGGTPAPFAGGLTVVAGAAGGAVVSLDLASATSARGFYRFALPRGGFTLPGVAGGRLAQDPEFTYFNYAAGDMNCDGAVNNLDIAAFARGLTDAAGFAASFGYAPTLPGDVNRDGAFDNLDIAPFVALLTGGGAGAGAGSSGSSAGPGGPGGPTPQPPTRPGTRAAGVRPAGGTAGGVSGAPGLVGGSLFSDEPISPRAAAIVR
jgi:predicted outer membrane repeat protein